MTSIDYNIIAVYLFVISMIGLYAGRGLSSLKEYAVAGRSYGSFVLMATLSASFIGGGFSFGNADTVFNQGLMVSTALWGFSLMLLLVGIFIAPRIAAFRDCISTGDIMHTQLGKSGKVVSGLLGAMVCTGILAAQIGAIGAIFSQLTTLSFMEGVFVGCGIVILYTAFGGMKAVIWTDVIQFILLIVFIPVAFFFSIDYLGGLDNVINKAPSEFFALPQDSMAWMAWLGLFLSFLIGETLVPPYVQRLLITKSPKATRRGIIASGLLSIPFFIITGLIGVFAYMINSDILSNLAMPMVIETVVPVGFRGLMAAAIIAVVMSSADSFLNSASVCIIEDVIRPLKGKGKIISDKVELGLSQLLTVIIGISAVFIALSIQNVMDVLLFSYNFWAPVILIPLICILLGKNVHIIAFWASAIVGIACVLFVFMFFGGQILGFKALVISVLFSGTVFITMSNWLNGKKSK